MKIDLQEISKRVDYIATQKHDTLPLLIHNYTQRAQFEKMWDEYTLQCRGLITDLEGNIVARTFKKFFNISEGRDQMPLTNPIIYDKFDGSLGIQYYANDSVEIATRGSFNSDQAKWATRWMWDAGYTRKDFIPGYTYLYEIVYPQNRIVVDYGSKQSLILLAVIDTETGEEIPYHAEGEAERLGFESANHLTYTDLTKFVDNAKAGTGNQEGYVFHWPLNGNLRMKIKSDEYVRLHRLITGFSTKSIWECLMNKQSFDEVLENVPDEFYDWVKEKKKELELAFDKKMAEAHEVLKKVDAIDNRKAQAVYLRTYYPDVMNYVFSLLDSKDISTQIWRTLKPKWELPFKKDIDA